MAVNVKKRTAHNIFLGIDAMTGQTRHISEVPSGAKCGCICALCGEPLEARKGMKRRHHFAHDANYNCMYANEVAIYMRVAEILKRDKIFCVPGVNLQFANWKESILLRARQPVKLDEVEYHCEPEQYPPELLVAVSGSKLRVLIDFGDSYYSHVDFDDFRTEAREKGYSILLLKMPRFCEENENYYTRENLTKCLTSHGTPGEWILSALEQKWRKRYLDLVTEPRKIGNYTECPLHQCSGGAPEPFFVRHWVCARCEYCLEEGKCTGASGVRELSDFDLSPEERQAKVDALRKKYEEEEAEHQRRRAESIRNMTEEQRQLKAYLDSKSTSSPLPPPPILRSKAQRMHDEAVRIFESFDPEAPEKTVDAFDRRWLKCDICGRIMQEEAFVEFGGPNRGICRFCRHSGIGGSGQ